MKKRILLWDIPHTIFVVLECESGVVYQNQVGGVVCWRGQQEGALLPFDVPESFVSALQQLPFPQGIQGITVEVADAVDALLQRESSTRTVRCDRARLQESWEAWIYVRVGTPPMSEYNPDGVPASLAYGFGGAGVLTWINSD